MKSILLSLLCIVAILTLPIVSYGARPSQAATPDLTSSLTVLGLGTASAAPDNASVLLQIGEPPSLVPGVQELILPDSGQMEFVRELLVENGVDEDKIRIDLFSSIFPYAPANFASEIIFTHAEPNSLSALLLKLKEKMAGRPGPTILNAQVVFLVEDCAALEEAAMLVALENARQRAARMAGLQDMTRGRLISVSEDHGSVVAFGTTGGCIALEGKESFGMDSFISGASSLVNTTSEVEVAIMLKATFALEP